MVGDYDTLFGPAVMCGSCESVEGNMPQRVYIESRDNPVNNP